MMMLVVDVTKGIQTQTAECLVIGEIACEEMVVVLNKIDLLPAEKRRTSIEKVSSRDFLKGQCLGRMGIQFPLHELLK